MTNKSLHNGSSAGRWLDRAVSSVVRRVYEQREVHGPSAAEPDEPEQIDLRVVGGADVGDSAIFHRFSFTLGEAIHPEEAARKALDSGLAVSAVNVWGEVLVGSATSHSFAQLQKLEASMAALQTTGRAGMLRFLVRHPATAMGLFNAWRTARDEPSEEASEDGENREDQSISEMIEDLRMTFAQTAVLEGLATYVDAEVLRPQYIENEPWVRLSLPPVGVTRLGSEAEHFLDVSVVVHRSGEAVMTFALLLESEDASVDLLNRWAGCTEKDVVASSIDRRVLELYRDETDSTLIVPEATESSGRPVVDFDGQHMRTSLGDVFNTYRSALAVVLTEGSLPAHFGEFLMTPMIAIRGLRDEDHTRVGTALAAHYRSDKLSTSGLNVDDRYIRGPLSTWASTVFVSTAAVVVLARESFRAELADLVSMGELVSGQDWAYPEYAVGLAVDVALLRMRVTETFALRLAQADSLASLTRSAALALANFSELSSERAFRAGELTEIEKMLLDTLDFEQRQAAVLKQHELSTQVASAFESDRAQRSSIRSQLALGLLTVVVGVLGPLGVLAQLDEDDDPIFGAPASSISDWATSGLVIVPGVLLAGGLISGTFIAVRRLAKRWRRPAPLARLARPGRKRAARLPGGGVTFVRGDSDEDAALD